jgi:hypothetical protein
MLTPTTPLSYALALSLSLSLSLARSLAPALPLLLHLHRPRVLVAAAGLANSGHRTRVRFDQGADVVNPASALSDQWWPVIEFLSGYQSGY